MLSQFIGGLACVLVTIAYLPQVWRTWKTKQCMLSTSTLFFLAVGMFLWTTHAVIDGDWALTISSASSLAQLVFMSWYKRIELR